MHVAGINWQLTHELYEAELARLAAGTSTYASPGAAKDWILDELNRMNEIAVKEAEKQS